ncbi:hypothetical protein [Rosistilla oblonga]|uniref:hypothetical protein n=1 Tax=Rosistilla oblonga TaxID=2527990 RepID=UPI003A96A831
MNTNQHAKACDRNRVIAEALQAAANAVDELARDGAPVRVIGARATFGPGIPDPAISIHVDRVDELPGKASSHVSPGAIRKTKVFHSVAFYQVRLSP